LRGTPNDPLFKDQWNLQKVNAPAVWDVTTGGLTACGDTIVVAIIDAGFQDDLLDLRDNIWTNKGEIPNNGIDDDKNGYVDDYRGLNLFTKKDNHYLGFNDSDVNHGTAVAGVLGASGNNSRLISGVNWKIKLLLFSGIRQAIPGDDAMIRAYDYVIFQRRLYDSTGGKKGAFIPVTSMSAGFRNKKPSDQPMLCAVYDALGKLGILNFVAVTNSFEDVVAHGDMPAQCDKSSLISVTGTNEKDIKDDWGFSAKFVHLAAPAQNIPVLLKDEQTDSFDGTSFATPLVAGAAALLWSMPELGLCQLSKTKPVEAMNLVRNALLNGVDKLPSLANKTVTGGRLNIKQSLNYLRRSFGQPIGDFAILQMFPNPVVTKLNLRLQLPENATPDVLITNALGQILYQKTIEIKDISQPFLGIDVANFESGMYFLSLKTAGFQETKKFVVVRK
jgi:subtilisin family serine protease